MQWLLPRLLALLVLMVGPNSGIRVEVGPLEWPFCGMAWVGARRIVIAEDVEIRCGPLLPGIDIAAWVLAHEVCHILRPAPPGTPPEHPLWHGPAHQQCTVDLYSKVGVEVIPLE